MNAKLILMTIAKKIKGVHLLSIDHEFGHMKTWIIIILLLDIKSAFTKVLWKILTMAIGWEKHVI